MGICQVYLSTQKAARGALDWLPGLLTELFTSNLATAEDALVDTVNYLEKHARRTNMKRDKEIPLFKYGCHPSMALNDVVEI
jgi:hypothetical protein